MIIITVVMVMVMVIVRIVRCDHEKPAVLAHVCLLLSAGGGTKQKRKLQWILFNNRLKANKEFSDMCGKQCNIIERHILLCVTHLWHKYATQWWVWQCDTVTYVSDFGQHFMCSNCPPPFFKHGTLWKLFFPKVVFVFDANMYLCVSVFLCSCVYLCICVSN